ncbi:MAG: class I SAM-dependent methyltransferase [Acidobacteria bacterium]|nr:class I SAM-dependent methyltransferase [Acidobacteriota bacterium]
METAQTEKFDLPCRKPQLNSSDHLLEIGGGWGGFAVHAARNYGCRITSITISQEQLKYAQEMPGQGALQSDRVSPTDYRQVTGKFDKIVSIEMLRQWEMNISTAISENATNCLKKTGLAIQVITRPASRYESHRRMSTGCRSTSFRGCRLSIGIMNKAINATGDLQLHNLEEMGHHYVRTLASWREKLQPQTGRGSEAGFQRTIIRKWNYYLTSCEAAFSTRNITVVQAVFTRPNNLVSDTVGDPLRQRRRRK